MKPTASDRTTPDRMPKAAAAARAERARVADELLVAFVIDDARERIDIVVHHRTFAAMGEAAWQLTYEALDAALTADGVERWIGAIQLADDEPDDAKPMAFLVEAVGVLAQTASGEQFALFQAEDDLGRPVFAMINVACKRIDHPECTRHVVLALAYAGDDAGLPLDGEAAALDDQEDDVIARLAPAIFVGRETGAGVRTLHFVAPADLAIEGDVAIEDDPEWDFLRRFD